MYAIPCIERDVSQKTSKTNNFLRDRGNSPFRSRNPLEMQKVVIFWLGDYAGSYNGYCKFPREGSRPQWPKLRGKRNV